MLTRVQGHGHKADAVPAPRKLHPYRVMGLMSFTKLAGQSWEGGHDRDGPVLEARGSQSRPLAAMGLKRELAGGAAVGVSQVLAVVLGGRPGCWWLRHSCMAGKKYSRTESKM